MAHALRPTYLLAPNWSFPVDGDIQLGNIVTDPFYPNYPLHSNLDHAESLTPVLSVENNWQDSVDTFRNTQVKLWAKLFSTARVDLQGYRRDAGSVGLRMAGLDTYALRKGELIAKIREWAEMPAVRNALQSRNILGRRQAVYVVSGLKIAREFRQYNIAAVDKAGSLSSGVQGGAGGSAQAIAQSHHTLSTEAANDIVFAYELVQVRLKRKETVEVSPYRPSEALLSDGNIIDKGAPEEDIIREEDLDTSDASLEDVIDFAQDRELDLDPAQYHWLFPTD